MLYRKYFLDYDTERLYVLQRNLNIIKNSIKIRYKGHYDNVLLGKKFIR